MKTKRITAGLLFIAVAAILILDATGVIPALSGAFGEISFWRVSGALLLTCLAVYQLTVLSSWFIMSLSLTFMLLEPNIAHLIKAPRADLISNWLLLGCTVLLMIGFSLLFDKKHSVKNTQKLTVNRFSDCKKFIDGADFDKAVVKNRWGATEISFENIESYRGEGVLTVENYMGHIEIAVPKSWNVKNNIGGFVSVVENDGSGNPAGPTLFIEGKNTMGLVEIIYR